jgi:hypothetical protein
MTWKKVDAKYIVDRYLVYFDYVVDKDNYKRLIEHVKNGSILLVDQIKCDNRTKIVDLIDNSKTLSKRIVCNNLDVIDTILDINGIVVIKWFTNFYIIED